MPRLIRHDERAQDVACAVVHLIDTRGAAAVSIRNIAELARIRPSTLTSHLTDRARILRITANLLAQRIEREIRYRTLREGPTGFLPDHEALPGRRAWLGLVELARTEPDLAAVVARTRADRANLLRELIGQPDRRLQGSNLDAVLAAIEGLTAWMCADVDPLPAERAGAALSAVLDALATEGTRQTTLSGNS